MSSEKSPPTELPNACESELSQQLDPQRPQFSWKRIGIAVSMAMLILVPWMVVTELGKDTLRASICNGQGITPAQYRFSGKSDAFDLTNSLIPREQILSGGPPKDGIPALSNPKFVSAQEVKYLVGSDRVLGVEVAETARAYPLKILNYHEIVNDHIKDIAFAVTYCPLCDSAAVFDRRTSLGVREFGVSGLLYNSNVLMYDRSPSSESLWSQILSLGVTGKSKSEPLQALPVELTTWKRWQDAHPQTKVLSASTGHNRDYSMNPYDTYFSHPNLMFPVRPISNLLPVKERVLGVWVGKTFKAYPESWFRSRDGVIEDTLQGKMVKVEFDAETQTMRVAKADDGVQWMYSLWFAWYAMHPTTSAL